jgi:outer membrane lipoprotein carrier protein
MRKSGFVCLMVFSAVLILWAATAMAQGQSAAPSAGEALTPVKAAAPEESVDALLDAVSKRYKKSAFCMDFAQIATLKGMGITDTAKGKACFEFPDKMHWHYTDPEEQHVVSDGKKLWVYRPLDNQVTVGEARAFFGGGGGSSFFADIRLLATEFDVSWGDPELLVKWGALDHHILRMAPKTPRVEFTLLYLVVDKTSNAIFQSVSYNQYGDETRIQFNPPEFTTGLPKDEFTFTPPKGVDVVRMEENQ